MRYANTTLRGNMSRKKYFPTEITLLQQEVCAPFSNADGICPSKLLSVHTQRIPKSESIFSSAVLRTTFHKLDDNRTYI